MECRKVKIDTSDFFAWKEGKGEVVPLRTKKARAKIVIKPPKSTVKPDNRTIAIFSPEVMRAARAEQKRMKSENWKRQMAWWALGRTQEEAYKADREREREAKRRKEDLLMRRDPNFSWMFLTGLCAFKTEVSGIVNENKCIICCKPIPSYMCKHTDDFRKRVWDSSVYYSLRWGRDVCNTKECFFFNERSKGNCKFDYMKVDRRVCEDNRCRRVYFWWDRCNLRQLNGVSVYDLTFEQRGVFILAKYIIYLLTNKKEKEKWQKKRAMRKQGLMKKA